MTIEQRVAGLERQARRWRTLTTLCAAALGYLLLSGQAGPFVRDEIRTKNLVVTNDKGVECASLGIAADGRPQLVLYGVDTEAAAVMSIAKDGAATLVLTASERDCAVLAQAGNDGPCVSALDRKTGLGLIMASRDDKAQLQVFGDDDVPSLSLEARSGGAGLAVKDVRGRSRACIGVTDDGPSVALLRTDGRSMWQVPVIEPDLVPNG